MSEIIEKLSDALNGDLPYSEFDIADTFSTEHADDLRFDHERGRWLEYRGTHWRVDKTTRTYDLIRETCRQAAAKANQGGKQIASARFVAAVERLARADRRHATLAEDWDADPFALNTPGGVVDLRTGTIRPNRPDDLANKITAAGPGGNCPVWLAFLKRITDDNADLVAFLQRAIGYMATGDTREHALFFGYGPGANGKSALLNSVSRLLGDYHRTAPIEVFMASRTDRHPTELAGLHGARLVTAIETEANRSWAESKIKALTGGDTISARYMRQDFFEFTPRFKLFVVGNHKPRLKTVDEAIRRRLHLIPFEVVIPMAERDLDLPNKLQAEWPGILSWIIEGAVDWHANGLQAPAIVTDATLEYLNGEDLIEVWIEDRATKDKQARRLASELYANFKEWAEANGERVTSQRAFSQALQDKGYEKKKTMKGRFFCGLRV